MGGVDNDFREECDDGDGDASDGCSDTCTIEAGYVCPSEGVACVLDECGDGNLDAAGLEACDDGNTVDGDGCSADCQLMEPGWFCVTTADEPPLDCDVDDCGTGVCSAASCGDGFVAGDEECDDANFVGDDGCSQLCRVEEGYYCPDDGNPATPDCVVEVCGNSLVRGLEECDDGNGGAGDGCSDTCKIELGYACPTPGSACVATTCGDSVVEGAEECDDGNATPNDGCDADCQFEVGFDCPTPGAACVRVECGDGLIEGAEECDDGKTCDNGDTCSVHGDCTSGGLCLPRSGDGCDPLCRIEAIYDCVDGECTPVCGDGITIARPFECDEPGVTPEEYAFLNCGGVFEECDDGNLQPGDGCSAGCNIESGFSCSSEINSVPDSIQVPIVYRDFRARTDIDTDYTGAGLPVPSLLGHPHMDGQSSCSNDGIVESVLDNDGLPILSDNPEAARCYRDGYGTCPSGGACQPGDGAEGGTNDANDHPDNGGSWSYAGAKALFDEWYRDVPGTNIRIDDRLRVYGELQCLNGSSCNDDSDCGGAAGSCTYRGRYVFNSATYHQDHPEDEFLGMGDNCPTCPNGPNLDRGGGFFPINRRGAGDYRSNRRNETSNPPTEYDNGEAGRYNYHFTSELRAYFRFRGGEELTFTGDDDVWFFINNRLAVDIGGLHGALTESVQLCTGSGGESSRPSGADCPEVGICYDRGTTNACSGADCTCGDGTICALDVECDDTLVYDPLVETFAGGIYEVVVFQAERQWSQSNYRLTLDGFVNAGTTFCAPVCGDGVVVGSERCDDGQQCDDGTTCTADADCVGRGDADELCLVRDASGDLTCDDGSACTIDGDCVGKGVSDEVCDTRGADGCDASCLVEPGYVCDNSSGTSVCTTPDCGDGVVEYPEACDNGGGVGSHADSSTCVACLFPDCGDDVHDDPPEDCDGTCSDGSLCDVDGDCAAIGDGDCRFRDDDTSACLPNCTFATCGDGFIQTGVEECDDANTSNTDNCTNSCLVARCGDGFVGPGEVCDDGINDSSWGECSAFGACGMPASCLFDCSDSGPYCGDGTLQPAFEECDDPLGNDGSYDGCDTDCTLGPYCGDGNTDAPEEDCDDGNDVFGDGCNPDCTTPSF